MTGHAFTLAELRNVVPIGQRMFERADRRARANAATFCDHVKAAHQAMLKECGLPLDTPMPLVYVRPGRP